MTDVLDAGVGAGAGVADAGAGAGAGVDTGAGSGAGAGAGDNGAGAGTPESPKSFSFSFEEGTDPVEVELDSLETEPEAPKEVTFESLKDVFKDPAHMETYKSLKKPLSEYGRYKKTFETPEAAVEHMAKIDDLAARTGIEGAKGLDGVAQYIDITNQVLKGISEGDPTIAEKLFAGNAAGMSKFAQESSNQWYKADKQGWTKHHADVMWATLTTPDSQGQTALSALQQAYNQSEDPAVKTLLERVGKTIETVATATKYKGPGADKDPQILAEKTKLQTEKQNLFHEKSEYTADRLIEAAATQTLGQMLSQLKITGVDKTKRGEYITALKAGFFEAVKGDAATMAKLKEAREAMDLPKIEAILKGVKSRFMTEAAKDLWKKQLGPKKKDVRDAAGSRREATGGAGSGEPGAIKFTGALDNRTWAPPTDVMDFPRMRAHDAETGKSMLEGRQFYMKGKKEVFYW